MNKNIYAFTLIELLVALTMLVILGGVTVTGLTNLSSQAKAESLRTSLTQLLNHAHRQSEILHRPVTLCKSTDLQHCGGEWSDGLLLFIDDAEDGVIHDKNQILSALLFHQARGTLHARFYPKSREYIAFHPLTSASQDNGTFWYCHASAQLPAWAVRINRMGVVSSMRPDKLGEIRDNEGKLLVC